MRDALPNVTAKGLPSKADISVCDFLSLCPVGRNNAPWTSRSIAFAPFRLKIPDRNLGGRGRAGLSIGVPGACSAHEA